MPRGKYEKEDTRLEGVQSSGQEALFALSKAMVWGGERAPQLSLEESQHFTAKQGRVSLQNRRKRDSQRETGEGWKMRVAEAEGKESFENEGGVQLCQRPPQGQ